MKILIVDDHAYNRELLAFILEDEGHDYIEADNGRDAVAAFCANQDIQLILMDVNMPIMNGIEATQEIKRVAGERFVTVIFVTALDNVDILVKCLDAGGDDFVPKPINQSILISKIKAHSRNSVTYNTLKRVNEQLEHHKRLIEREHRIVEHIFSNDMGSAETKCDNINFYTSPASLFNGDLVLSAPSPSGGVYLVIGDFTGHGLAAAVGSLPVSGLFYDCVSRQESISTIACLINKRLLRILPPGMFFCATLVYLEPSGHQLQVWAGGMNDIIIRVPGQSQLRKIPSQHLPLGILREDEFDSRIELLDLPQGTALYIFTDGLNEARNRKDEEFGFGRIDSIIANGNGVIEELIETVRTFTLGCEQADDVSVVELTCCPVVHRIRSNDKIADLGAGYRDALSFEWNLTMRLQADDLRATDIVLQVGKILGTIQGIEFHQDKIFTIMSELISNALDHGVLRLSSSLKNTPDGFDEYYRLRRERLAKLENEYILIEMQYLKGSRPSENPNRLEIIVTDSGNGFNPGERKLPTDSKGVVSGRGISLLETYCESLRFSNSGRTATAIYAFT
jgi:CheY-like chemotaxis protein/anti-sigma regulatory factor (Ser/Thr protein kinase)